MTRKCCGAGTTTRASVSGAGAEVYGFSYSPLLSADGRYVVFSSLAGDLAPSDSNYYTDVFVRDTVAGTTTLLSISRTGQAGNLSSFNDRPGISDDGQVVFITQATNLAAGVDFPGENVVLTRIANFLSSNSTTTAIIADTPDPSLVNAIFTVSISVTRTFTADVTGTVLISDGSDSCTATLSGSGTTATGSCPVTSRTAGAKQLAATYSGDTYHAPSASAAAAHTVNLATLTGFTA